MKLARESGDILSVGNAYAGLGELYRVQGMWAQAQRSYEREAAIMKNLNDQAGTLFEEINIGSMAERQGHYQEAFAYGKRSLKQAQRMQILGEIPRVQLLLARAFLHTGQPDSALAHAKNSLRASQRHGTKNLSRDASEVLAQASSKLGRYADAYRYEQLFGAYKDTLNSSDLQRRAAVLEYRAELAKNKPRLARSPKPARSSAGRTGRSSGFCWAPWSALVPWGA
ncbi:tetratricopeptide repeat protein [Hymenobacter humi]|uniref:Tetratricopeptide repeat protein n=1 Tax=Hymenobacter humi TaxID=1411620 RepID=A0ABW2U1H5_9BACT